MGTNIRLGEYIHAKYANYLGYGLEKAPPDNGLEDPPVKIDINKILNEQKILVQQQAKNIMSLHGIQNKEIFRKKLEGRINYFYNNPKKWRVRNGDSTISLHEAIVNALNENLLPNSFQVDQNLRVTQVDDTVKSRFNALSTKSDVIFIQSIISRLLYVKQAIAQLQAQGALSQNWIAWDEEATRLLNMLINIQNDVNRADNNFMVGTKKLFGKDRAIFGAITLEGVVQQRSLVEDVNRLINDVQQKTQAYWAGQVGEIDPLIVQEMIKLKALVTTQQQVNEIAQSVISKAAKYGQEGFSSSKGVIKASLYANFSNQLKDVQKQDKKIIANDLYVAGLGKAKHEISYTQDKVDIRLSFSDPEDSYISVKNYNLEKNNTIKLLSGANIIYYLQEYPEFINHYLNITAQHFSPSKKTRKRNNGTIYANNLPAVGDVQAAHSVMILSIALKAIAGGVLTQTKQGTIGLSQEAPIFLINDSSHGGYRVFFVDDLITAISNNISLIQLKDFNMNKRWRADFIQDTKNKNGSINNYSNAYKRIIRLLYELQGQKLKMSISKNALY